MMREEMDKMKDMKGYVLLDYVTDYNKIVVEYEIDSMATFEKSMSEYKKEMTNSKDADKPPAYTELYQTGRREIFKVVE